MAKTEIAHGDRAESWEPEVRSGAVSLTKSSTQQANQETWCHIGLASANLAHFGQQRLPRAGIQNHYLRSWPFLSALRASRANSSAAEARTGFFCKPNASGGKWRFHLARSDPDAAQPANRADIQVFFGERSEQLLVWGG